MTVLILFLYREYSYRLGNKNQDRNLLFQAQMTVSLSMKRLNRFDLLVLLSFSKYYTLYLIFWQVSYRVQIHTPLDFSEIRHFQQYPYLKFQKMDLHFFRHIVLLDIQFTNLCYFQILSQILKWYKDLFIKKIATQNKNRISHIKTKLDLLNSFALYWKYYCQHFLMKL